MKVGLTGKPINKYNKIHYYLKKLSSLYLTFKFHVYKRINPHEEGLLSTISR